MQTTNLIIYIVCYVVFFVLSWMNKVNNSQNLINGEGNLASRPGNLIGSYIVGILWLGAVPMILLKQPVLKVLAGDQVPDISYIIFFILVLALIVFIAIKQGENRNAKYQQSVEAFGQLSSPFLISYFILRIIFLVVYELWFRGFLLFDTITWLGMPAAVTINIFLYVLVHIFNSKKEILVCIPFGILVCFFSILFNAAWPAIILHIGFSVVYELNICRSYFYSSKIARL